jgi:hypothetical protein
MTTRWELAGEYVEACNCDVACQCLWLEAPDDGACTGAIGWHITEGRYGDVDLGGRKVAMLIAADEGVMFDSATKWDVVLLVDDEASDDERAAIEDIYLGRAGGIWAPVAEGHFRSTEVTTAPIEFGRDGDTTTISVGDDVAIEAVEKAGFNEEAGTVSPHPLTSSLTMKTAKSTNATVSYDERFDWDVGGNNAYVCDFELTNA